MGGVHKTVNSHSSMLCCGCSCIFSCYVIMWNRINLQIGNDISKICEGLVVK